MSADAECPAGISHWQYKGTNAYSFELESWPSSDVLTQLVEQSSGVFIFAATVAYFVEDESASSPIQQL